MRNGWVKCSFCQEDLHESHPHFSGENAWLCYDCLKSFFFEAYSLYSIPLLPESKGYLRHTSKSLGRRNPIPRLLRDMILRRDKYTCQHCGTKNKKTLTIDHIHPYKLGGEDKPSNFQVLCRSCNSKKGAKK